MTKSSNNYDEAPLNIPSAAAERFFNSFEKSARRWEMIIYPGMILVVIFMAYGFYLIYNLTNDMRTMVARFDDPQIVSNLNSMSTAMHSLSTNIKIMTDKVDSMSDDTRSMAVNTKEMTGSAKEMTNLMTSIKHMKSMDVELKKMNQIMHVMGGNVNYMRQDMAHLNHSISRPLGMMNSVMPF